MSSKYKVSPKVSPKYTTAIISLVSCRKTRRAPGVQTNLVTTSRSLNWFWAQLGNSQMSSQCKIEMPSWTTSMRSAMTISLQIAVMRQSSTALCYYACSAMWFWKISTFTCITARLRLVRCTFLVTTEDAKSAWGHALSCFGDVSGLLPKRSKFAQGNDQGYQERVFSLLGSTLQVVWGQC